MKIQFGSKQQYQIDAVDAVLDPFDRLLLAQALSEGIILLTGDPQLARYPGPVRKV